MNSNKPKIFVQIASYRDPELIWTVKSIYETAKYPERVFLGICNQIDLEADKEFNSEPYPFKQNVREIIVPALESKGVCWARHEAQKLYRDEDYVLMIDSHMRFIKNWDEIFINELSLCDSEKPIFANYPAAYTPPNELKPINKAIVQVAKEFNDQGDLRFTSRTLPSPSHKPLRGAFIAAGFLFSKGSLIKEVPYDPYMYFGQEEITLAVRYYTHGWDVFSPRMNFIYHMYIRVGEDRKRKLQWEDSKDWTKQTAIGKKRYKYLLTGIKDSTPEEFLIDIDKFGLGKVRSLKQFEEYTGINFLKKRSSEKAQKGWFIEDIEKYIPAQEVELIKQFEENKIAEINSNPEYLSDIGNEIPNFTLIDNLGNALEIKDFAGKNSVIFFLPVNLKIYIKDLFEYLETKKELVSKLNFNRVYILNCSAEEAQKITEEFNIKATLFTDENADIYKAFGLGQKAKTRPTSLVLDSELRIKSKFIDNNAINNLADVLRAV
jgi:peroxiredoxin